MLKNSAKRAVRCASRTVVVRLVRDGIYEPFHCAVRAEKSEPVLSLPKEREQSCLQLSFKFIDEPQVHPLRNDLLRSHLDQADLVQSQREKAHAVLKAVGAPAVVRKRFEYFKRDVIALLVAFGDQ